MASDNSNNSEADDPQLTTESEQESQKEIKSDDTTDNNENSTATEEVGTSDSGGNQKAPEEEDTSDSGGNQTAPSPSTSKTKTKKKFTKKSKKSSLSSRLEYLARPRRDYLDSFIEERLDGALPENPYPSWYKISLATKIPLAGTCRIPLSRRKISTKLFLPPTGGEFDLEDENNLQLPTYVYDNKHDPYLREYFGKDYVYETLRPFDLITDTEKAKCRVNDINKYRIYQRRILANETRKQLRDEDEEYFKKRDEGEVYRLKRERIKYQRRRTQGVMRRWLKSTVSSIKDRSMKDQMIIDCKVLNSQIARQKAQADRVAATAERYQRLYAEHIREKYADREKFIFNTHMNYAKKDAEHLEKLCKIQEREKQERFNKNDDFWKRKYGWQEEWLEEGEELDRMRQRERERDTKIYKKTNHLPLLFYKKKKKGSIKSASPMEKKSAKRATPPAKSLESPSETSLTDENEQEDVKVSEETEGKDTLQEVSEPDATESAKETEPDTNESSKETESDANESSKETQSDAKESSMETEPDDKESPKETEPETEEETK